MDRLSESSRCHIAVETNHKPLLGVFMKASSSIHLESSVKSRLPQINLSLNVCSRNVPNSPFLEHLFKGAE